MEAVCSQCQMRYEVGEELLQQGTPVLCPTCQVALTFVHPGTNDPIEVPVSETAPAPEPTADPSQEETAPAEQAAPEVPAEQASETAPSSSGQSWGSESLAWGEEASSLNEPSSLPSEASAEEGQPADQPPPSDVATVPFEQPVESPPSDVATTVPYDASPESVPSEVSSEMEADAPAEQAEVAVFTTPAWSSAEATEDQPASAPEAPEDQPPPSDVATVPFAQPEESTPDENAEGEPVPEAPAQPASSSAEATEDRSVPAADTTAQAAGGQPGLIGDDWASAAAQWAASGFSSDNMPEFVKSQEQALEGGAPVVQPQEQVPAQQPEPPVQEPALPETTATPESPGEDPEVLAEVEPLPSSAPQESMDNQEATEGGPAAPAPEVTPAPPPLPKQEIVLPSPQTPPPLEGKRQSTYVMRGTGEGRKEGPEAAPWDQAPTVETLPGADKQPVQPEVAVTQRGDSLQMKIPTTPIAVPVEPPLEKPAAVPVAKPSRAGTWVFVIVLFAIGAGAAWMALHWEEYFGKKTGKQIPSKAGVIDRPSHDVAKVDAGLTDAGAEEVVDAGVVATKVDAGTQKDIEGKPGDIKKKPPEDKVGAKKKRKKKRKKKDVASVDKPKRDPELAKKHYQQGNKLIRAGKFPAALAEFRDALKADSRMALAHRGMGIAYAQMKKNKAACKEYRIYSKMLPKNSPELPQLKEILKGCK